MTKKGIIVLFVTTLLIGMGSYGPARAESDAKQDPLIDRLIEKGILTEEEAEEIRQEEAILEKQRQQKEAEEIQDNESKIPKGLKGVKLGALWYLDYSSGEEPESDDESSSYNEFRVTRGYLTVKKRAFSMAAHPNYR